MREVDDRVVNTHGYPFTIYISLFLLPCTWFILNGLYESGCKFLLNLISRSFNLISGGDGEQMIVEFTALSSLALKESLLVSQKYHTTFNIPQYVNEVSLIKATSIDIDPITFSSGSANNLLN